jgi:2-polyprenyl-3-methyl-5-hydroxy-6-metoxy-1,4-benzoquinol methylase
MASTPSPAVPALDRAAVDRWRRSWDEVMAGFLPGAASLEAALPAVAEAVFGGAPRRVLDVGGGPGVFAERMADRWPGAHVGMVDLDPVLLALARAGAGGRIHVHRGDLESSWSGAVAADGPYDLLTIVMTMHYLAPERALAVYRAARAVLRPGGLMVVADLMPETGLAEVMGRLQPAAGEAAAGLAWTRWWAELTGQEPLRRLLDERRATFADRVPAEFAPPVEWHRSAARQAGFREAGVVWRWGAHAALAAVV